MDLPQDKTAWVDMTKSGKFCFMDGRELEQVSETTRYTCHFCGGIYEWKDNDAKGTATIEVHFTGFK